MIVFFIVVADVHRHIAHHVTILTATEYGAVDGTAGNVYMSILYVGTLVEEHTLVALTTTEQIAGHGVSSNLSQCTRHTERGFTAETYMAITQHIGHLVAAIDVGQDMTTGNLYPGIAIDLSGFLKPLTWSVRIVARTATEDVAVEGMAIGGHKVTTFSSIAIGVLLQLACGIGELVMSRPR